MIVQELYKRFLLMINKNDTNEGVSIPVGNFVLLFNSEVLRWEGEELKKDEDNIDINMIQLFWVPDADLGTPTTTSKEFIEYAVPKDYFQIYGTYSYASKGECKQVKISNYEKKPGNIIPILQDGAAGPDFELREAPFIVGSDKIRIYKEDDYTIEKSLVNYYRVPKPIDMQGYTHFDGTPSEDVNPEMDDQSCVEILEKLAVEIARQTADAERFQLDKDRTITNPH
jgi:hypothetical protein